jgi:Family of unknown function (DUF6284)
MPGAAQAAKHSPPRGFLPTQEGIFMMAPIRWDAQEPTAAELATIEAEWPFIDAELAVLDAEIRALSAAGGPSLLDQRRLRRARRRVGSHDQRILAWLAQWDDYTARLVVSMLVRARRAGYAEAARRHGGDAS